jgi:hypothetical protein
VEELRLARAFVVRETRERKDGGHFFGPLQL